VIEGEVGPDRLPRVTLSVGGREWPAAIDTGFNGDLELPQVLAREVGAQYDGTVYSVLADGRQIFEESYRVQFPFDGEGLAASATFAAVDEILTGTRLLRRHRLEIDFEARTVLIRRARREGG
jgi:predicted aspartyl protease